MKWKEDDMGKKVQVLMSTYNGEKYLREQLDSILRQDYPEWSLLVRDDGSSDKTVLILDEYARCHPNVEYYVGENIGVINSFFELMGKADLSASYYALSDQDDVWIKNKLSRAVSILGKYGDDKVALYCCRELLVDEQLKTLPMRMKYHKKRPGFGNSLVENIATGATCVLNRSLLTLTQRHVPDYTVMHDWWLYMVASCFGKVYYDEKPYMMYRQHANNVLGSRSNYFEEFRIRLRRFGNNSGKLSKQAKAFQKSFHIKGRNKEALDILLYYDKRFRYRLKGICTNRVYRQRWEDHLIFKLLFLTNHI